MLNGSRRMRLSSLGLCGVAALIGCKDDDPEARVALSSSLPPDVSIVDPTQPKQSEFDRFSWQTFIALAWPSNPDGTPTAGPIGVDGDAVSVMERWSTTADLIDAPQAAFGTRYVPDACQGIYNPGMLVLGQAAKKSGAFQDEILEASGEPLVDVNGAFTRYTISVNRSMFDTIVGGGWFTASGQDGADVLFACGDTASGATGAVEVKLSWKLLTSSEATSGRFHQRDAVVYVPATQSSTGTASCDLETVGLVGLHIVRKTSQQQAWVWTTFEHEDNVPDCVGQDAPGFTCPTDVGSKSYSYFTETCPDADPGCTACNVAPVHNSADGMKYVVDAPAQRSLACRPSSILDSAQTLNTAYRAALTSVNPSSVWQHYLLVNTQWNTAITTDGSCANVVASYDKAKNAPQDTDGNPLPVGNMTMETYDWNKNQTAGSGWVNPSCINCHAFAQTAGTPQVKADFIYFLGIEVD